MKYLDNNLYIEFGEAVQWLGISESYLWLAINRGLKCWPFCKDPDDGRRVLFRYEGLKAKYRKLIQKHTGDPYRYLKDQSAITEMEAVTEEQRLLPDIVDATKSSDDYEHFRKQMDEQGAIEHTKAAAWLRLLTSIRGKKDARRYGFESKAALLGAALAFLKKDPLKPLKVSHVDSLKRRMCRYNKNGLDSVTMGYSGNANAAKLTEGGKRYLVALMADAHKPPFPIVARLYNKKAVAEGWKMVDPNTCANYLNRPEVQRTWMLGRHGESAWYNAFDMTIRRERASAPDVLWIIDGTPSTSTTGRRWTGGTGRPGSTRPVPHITTVPMPFSALMPIRGN